MSMRAQSGGGGQFETSRVYRSLCAQCGCVNHRKFNGRPSLRVPPGSFDAKISCLRVFLYCEQAVVNGRSAVSFR